MKVILVEGPSDATALHKITQQILEHHGATNTLDEKFYNCTGSKPQASEHPKLEQSSSEICICYTEGNTHLVKASFAILDLGKISSLAVIYDLDDDGNENIKKLEEGLEVNREYFLNKEPKRLLEQFTFTTDLEGFFIEYLESSKPEWYQKVKSCSEAWLRCLLAEKSEKSQTFDDAIEPNKNKEILLRLVNSITNSKKQSFIQRLKFPECFFEAFGFELSKIESFEQGKELCQFLVKFLGLTNSAVK